MPDNKQPTQMDAARSKKVLRARQLRSRLYQVDNLPQFQRYRELLKHKAELRAWFNAGPAEFYKEFLTGAIEAYTKELVHNFLDDKKNDLSPIIRGRLYAFGEILGIPDEMDSYDKMKAELMALENEGFKATPDEGLPN